MSQSPVSGPILVVDDEPALRRLMTTALGQLGFAVETASNGGEAFELVGRVEPCLVILDYRMPGENGVEVARELRRRGFDAPLVLISGAADAATLAGEAGTPHWLNKPIGLKELRELLHRIGLL